jgi:hypothetical protein
MTSQPLSETVTVRFPDELAEAARQAAAAEGKSTGEWVRSLIGAEVERRTRPRDGAHDWPEEARLAAAAAIDARISASTRVPAPCSADLATDILDAVAPMIRAAEREEIRQLAIRAEAVCAGDEGTSCFFADLIGDDSRRIVSAPSVPELVAVGNGPLLDPDCRDGKHASCMGPPCECPVPGVHTARHDHERSQP